MCACKARERERAHACMCTTDVGCLGFSGRLPAACAPHDRVRCEMRELGKRSQLRCHLREGEAFLAWRSCARTLARVHGRPASVCSTLCPEQRAGCPRARCEWLDAVATATDGAVRRSVERRGKPGRLATACRHQTWARPSAHTRAACFCPVPAETLASEA